MDSTKPCLLTELDPQPKVPADRYGKALARAVEHADGTEDPVYAADPAPRQLQGTPQHKAAVDELWLPEGHHWDLHIEHRPLESAGPFTGGANGLCWHTTESEWDQVDLMWQVLRDKRAAPQLLIGGRPGLLHPVVIQMQPFNRAGRALAHPSGPETNRADKIQVEVCGRTSEAVDWSLNRYEALANLFVLVTHRFPIVNRARQDFSDPRRFGGQEWVDAGGHMDHAQCPGNTHTDVSRMREGRLIQLVDDIPAGGYDL